MNRRGVAVLWCFQSPHRGVQEREETSGEELNQNGDSCRVSCGMMGPHSSMHSLKNIIFTQITEFKFSLFSFSFGSFLSKTATH